MAGDVAEVAAGLLGGHDDVALDGGVGRALDDGLRDHDLALRVRLPDRPPHIPAAAGEARFGAQELEIGHRGGLGEGPDAHGGGVVAAAAAVEGAGTGGAGGNLGGVRRGEGREEGRKGGGSCVDHFRVEVRSLLTGSFEDCGL